MSNTDKHKQADIIINKSGPIKVSGNFTLTGVEGDKLQPDSSNEIYLCACGQSKNKPFCDGSHSRTSTQ